MWIALDPYFFAHPWRKLLSAANTFLTNTMKKETKFEDDRFAH
jgi:hypothetical protein